IREFSTQLKARIELEEKLANDAASNASQLKQERAELHLQAGHFFDAIAQHGVFSLLSSQLFFLGAPLAEVERLLTTKPSATRVAFSENEIREFLRKESRDFCSVLVADPEVAKREIQKRINKLVLTPKQTAHGIVLEVTGDVGLFQRPDVM